MARQSKPLPLFLVGILLLMLGVIWGSVEGQGYLPRLTAAGGVLLLLVFLVRNASEIRFLLLQTHSHSEPGPTITLMLIALVLALGAFVAEREFSFIDLTDKKLNSLAEPTRKTLEALEEPIQLEAFYINPSAEWNLAERYLEIYGRSSTLIRSSLVDPDRSPGQARAAGITRSGVIVISFQEARTEVWELTEEAITQGILRVLEGRPRRIGLLQGHGEVGRDIGGDQGLTALVNVLASENIEVHEINVLSHREHLDLVDALYIVHPKTPLYPSEVGIVTEFLEEGHGLGLWLEPGDSTGLEDYLDLHAVSFLPGVIRDQGPVTERIGLGEWSPALATNPYIPIGLELSGVFIASPHIQAIEINNLHSIDLDVHPLLMTTPTAERVSGTEGEDVSVLSKGSMKAGAVLEWEIAVTGDWDPAGDVRGLPPVKPKARLLVVGDSSILTNRFLGVTYNSSLAINAAHWLTWQERFLGADLKDRNHSPLKMSPGEIRGLFYIIQIGLPLLLILAGLILWFRRRSRS